MFERFPKNYFVAFVGGAVLLLSAVLLSRANKKATEIVNRKIDGFCGFPTPTTLGRRYSFIPSNQSADTL